MLHKKKETYYKIVLFYVDFFPLINTLKGIHHNFSYCYQDCTVILNELQEFHI